MFWILSFAKDGWLGAVITEAPTLEAAITKSHILGINPGGEILCGPLPPVIATLDDEMFDRLLNREDMMVIDIEMGGNGDLGVIQS